MFAADIRNIVSLCKRTAWFMTRVDLRDSRRFLTILPMGEQGATMDNTDILPVITLPMSDRFKIAISEFRLRYIDSHTDCRTIAVSIATVDCDIDCKLQPHVSNSGVRL
jgi:hypothetical protein